MAREGLKGTEGNDREELGCSWVQVGLEKIYMLNPVAFHPRLHNKVFSVQKKKIRAESLVLTSGHSPQGCAVAGDGDTAPG